VKQKRRAAGLIRHRSRRVAQRDECLPPRRLQAEPPFWAGRRIWAYLRFVEPQPVNKKRVLRLMRAHHLLVSSTRQLKAKRTPTRNQPQPTKPNELWGIDMTKVMIEGCGGV
jgi:putative transposase